PFFNPQQERFLEYEISRTLYTLTHPDRPVVGVMSPLPLDGVQLNPQTMQPQQGEPWYILQEIGALFEIQDVDVGATSIPDDVDILLLVHPKDLADITIYAIDQFVMRGGRLVLFIDPHCFADNAGQFRDQMEALLAPRWSNLPGPLAKWGLTMDHELVVGDLANALEVPIAGQRGSRDTVTYPPAVALGRDEFDDEDPIVAGLSSVSFFNPGELVVLDDHTTTITRLVETSTDTALVDVDEIRFGPTASVLAAFVPTDTTRLFGARISGPASSAFDTPPEGATGEHVAQNDDINVVVFSDVDMLQNSMWLRTLFAGMYQRVADNGSLLINALENLSGNSDLISLRARGSFQRPFERIDDLRRQAEQNFRAEEDRLNTRLSEIEREIQQIQSARPDAAELTGVLLTPEQQQKLADARQEQRTTRKAIRDLRLDLDRTIDGIETRIKFVNMGLIPIVVALVAVALGLYRTQRRRLDRKTLAGG
ncbi:MAG: Gldg family protein, partial [Phycisphaerales bacterium]|nr:Gldg family protein [Phycisphaerales bacterium]